MSTYKKLLSRNRWYSYIMCFAAFFFKSTEFWTASKVIYESNNWALEQLLLKLSIHYSLRIKYLSFMFETIISPVSCTHEISHHLYSKLGESLERQMVHGKLCFKPLQPNAVLYHTERRTAKASSDWRTSQRKKFFFAQTFKISA